MQLFISGQRAVKIVKPDHNDQLSWIYTYYIYDATGNVMATYTRRNYFDDIGDSSFAFVNDWIYNELGLTDLQDFMESKFSYNGQFMNDWIEYLSTNELAAGVFDEFSPDDFLGWDATLVPAVLSNFAHSPNASPTENDALLNTILSNQQSNFISSVLNSGTAVLNNALTAILSNDPTDLLLNCMATNNPVGLNSVYVSLGGSPVPPPTNASRIAYIRSFPPPTIASQISAIESISNLQNYFSSCLNSTMIYNSWNSAQPNISFTDLFDAWSGLGDTSLILDVLQNHYSNDAHLRILLKEVRTLQQLYQLASSSNYSSFVSNSINVTSYQDLSFVMYQSSALTFSSYLKQVRTHFGTTNYSSMMADIGEWLKFGKDILLQEQHIYGSTRLGMYQSNQLLVKYKYKYSDTLQIYLDSVKFDRDTNRAMRKLSHKQYELSNHLGNVLSTVLDRKTPITSAGGSGGSGGSTTITHYEGDVVFASDYYPFGSPMTWTTTDSSGGRLYSGGGYRYGFNGQEKVIEISGEGNHTTAMFWEMDPRLGRRWNQDPKPNPSISSFVIFANNPIFFADPLGDTIKVSGKKRFVKRINKALENIKGTEEGNRMYNKLHSSKNVITIREYYFNITKQSLQSGLPKDWSVGDIGFYGEEYNSGGLFMGEYGWLSLGHELSHAEDAIDGISTNETWQTPDETYTIPIVDFEPITKWVKSVEQSEPINTPLILMDEVRAMDRENKMRAQSGIELRTHYSWINVNTMDIYGQEKTTRIDFQQVVKDGIGTHPKYNTNYNLLRK